MARILLVEDDPRISGPLLRELALEGHTVELAEDGEAGWDLVQCGHYDLAIIDVMLPRLNGIDLCKRLRGQQVDLPVLLLTALDDSRDKVRGLDAGADDYLVKPFALDELHARIRALLRRRIGSGAVLRWGGQLELDTVSKVVTGPDGELDLTPREYQILELFLRNPGIFYSADDILDKVWGWDAPSRGNVKSHIRGLREKLGRCGLAGMIENQYGRGYRLRESS